MYYTYLIKSKKVLGWTYIGSTNDLKKRFTLHNSGRVVSTKNFKPFALVYYKAYFSEKDARTREHNLKLRAKALTQLRRRIIESINAS